MSEQVVLVTGASSGIGCATALAFARRGAHVAAVARRSERLAQLAEQIATLPAPHGDCLTLAADVTERDAMQWAVARTVERFGRLDALIANAGVSQRGKLVDAEWRDIDTLLQTNIDGVLHSIRAAIPALRQSGGGHIVIVSSIAASTASPYTAVYAASKAFVSSLAHSLQLELEDDHITVTDLIIGSADTELREKRLGAPGYADQAMKLPRMSAERVAESIVRATERRSKTSIPRWFDRLVLLGNLIVPGWIGRRSLRRYKTE